MPAQWDGLFGIVCSTLCVGGTFLVITLAAMQEARRTAAGRAAVLIAVMTGAFAFGQLLGPLAVGLAGSSSQALRVNLWLAATALLMGAVLLWLPGARSRRTVLG
jgi:predicted MFS family arabinose efflux permease